MVTWLEMIICEMEYNGDSLDDKVSCTLSIVELGVPFDSGYGAIEGEPFTLWTKKRVYFPVSYDGAECVGSVSRDPDGRATSHI